MSHGANSTHCQSTLARKDVPRALLDEFWGCLKVHSSFQRTMQIQAAFPTVSVLLASEVHHSSVMACARITTNLNANRIVYLSL